jgi:hypothetical protein
MIWDPPDANYIGPKSEICTPDQQHLAYAVKHLLLADPDACLKELTLVNPRTATVDVQRQAEMVQAIALKQPDVFLRSLEALLEWHEKTAARRIKQKHADYADFFLSIPGLGLVALALHSGLVQREHVPSNSVYLPLDLIQSSSS